MIKSTKYHNYKNTTYFDHENQKNDLVVLFGQDLLALTYVKIASLHIFKSADKDSLRSIIKSNSIATYMYILVNIWVIKM